MNQITETAILLALFILIIAKAWINNKHYQ